MDRAILHSDLNSFYASVECMRDASLLDRAVAVVGDPTLRHGIVLAKNERAKKCGVRTGQVIWEAQRLCPDLVTIKADYDEYMRVSRLVRAIYDDYTDRVESFGIDECWLDVSGLDGKKIADEIRTRIKDELRITASVGVSWNKIYSKLASDLKKPDATIKISRENYKHKIFGLPAEYLLYVGRSTKERLYKYNIRTIGDITACDVDFLKSKFGKWGEYLWVFAGGHDLSPVSRSTEHHEIKSVGNSTTTVRDLTNADEVLMIVTMLSQSVALRLRENGLKGQTVHLDIVDNTFEHFGKQAQLPAPTNISDTVIDAAMSIFSKYYSFKQPIRSVGVRVSSITSANAPKQISFFDSGSEIRQRLENTLDGIRYKYGSHSIARGIELTDKNLAGITHLHGITIS